MSDLWIPGASGPLDDLVARIHLRIEEFTEKLGKQPLVEVELRDGSTAVLRSFSPEPGFGFITLCPHVDEGDEEWIVPVAYVMRITLREAEEREPLGFAPPGR